MTAVPERALRYVPSAALLPEITAVKGCPVNSETPRNVPEWASLETKELVSRPTPVVDLPLGVTEDRVTGALDIERALTRGGEGVSTGTSGAGQPGLPLY